MAAAYGLLNLIDEHTRTGTEIAQVYVTLPDAAGEPFQRLAGWQRVELRAGESKTVTVSVDPRVLGVFEEERNSWKMLPGTYHVAAGASSASTPLKGEFEIR
jgi:beta-glucosidase